MPHAAEPARHVEAEQHEPALPERNPADVRVDDAGLRDVHLRAHQLPLLPFPILRQDPLPHREEPLVHAPHPRQRGGQHHQVRKPLGAIVRVLAPQPLQVAHRQILRPRLQRRDPHDASALAGLAARGHGQQRHQLVRQDVVAEDVGAEDLAEARLLGILVPIRLYCSAGDRLGGCAPQERRLRRRERGRHRERQPLPVRDRLGEPRERAPDRGRPGDAGPAADAGVEVEDVEARDVDAGEARAAVLCRRTAQPGALAAQEGGESVDAAEIAEVDFGAEEVHAGGGGAPVVGFVLGEGAFLEVGGGLGEGLEVAAEGGDGGGCFCDGACGDYEDEVG